MSMPFTTVTTVGVLTTLLLGGCLTNPPQASGAIASEAISSAERRANIAGERYFECINVEAEKKAKHEATPTEIANAVVAECEFFLLSFKKAHIDFAHLQFKSSAAKIHYVNGIENVVSDVREQAKGIALSKIISIRSSKPL